MTPFVARGQFDGYDSYSLGDDASQTRVEIIPRTGFCTTRFTARVGGKSVEILAPPPSIAALESRPAFYGIPILFPYPGVIRGGSFPFAGREIQLPPDPRTRRVVHGVVRNRAWTVTDLGHDDETAWLTGQIGTDSQPDLLDLYPFAFRLIITLSLRGAVLTYRIQVDALGPEPLPMGLGFHPYFQLPFGANGEAEGCEVWADVDQLWPQSAELPIGGPATPTGLQDLRAGQSFRALLDEARAAGARSLYLNLSKRAVRTGLTASLSSPNGVSVALRDRVNGVESYLESSAEFSVLGLYAPFGVPTISPMPQTCLPDAFNLAAQGIDSGMITLPPGHSWNAWFRVGVRSLG